jgi:putative glutamine amidotransferase
MGCGVRRPVIGICAAIERARWGAWDQDAALLPLSYMQAVQRAGGIALIVPPDEALLDDAADVLDLFDGLMLAGGADIDPASYGREAQPETTDTVRERDNWEIALTRAAIERDVPVLGICRGMQLINVACGGTLVQHLPDHLGHEEHRRVLGSFEGADHDVQLTEGSLAAHAAAERDHATKSHHHQGVDDLGDGLVVSGFSTLDELPEAIEAPDRRYVLGVQWHPEVDPASNVIASFVAAAAERVAEAEGSALPIAELGD